MSTATPEVASARRSSLREETGETVLVVDDDAGIRAVASAILEQHGYTALQAAHGGEALEIVASGRSVDLVLLDLTMPVMDGFACAAALAELPGGGTPPVLAFSATNPRPPLSAHFVGFLEKPVRVERLLSVIGHVLGRGGRRSSIS